MPELKESRSSTKPLEPTLRHQLESKLGTNLSDICVAPNHISAILGAESYTQGNTIYLNAGKIDPNTTAGQELIGHEAAHIVQQRPNNGMANETHVNRVKTSDKHQAAVMAFIKG